MLCSPRIRVGRFVHFRTFLVVVLLPILMGGCFSSKKYRLAQKDVAPARLINWSTSSASVDLTLATLIVFKGPGSWKREARWDEYVIQLHNRGDTTMVVESAELIDLLNQPQSPGDDPWILEKLSHTNWDKYGKNGLKLLAGAGAVVVYSSAITVVATTSILGGAAAGGGTSLLLLNIVPVIALVDIVAVQLINRKNKKTVQQEFDRRRLDLPLVAHAGATLTGSFFFPMTPGPQALLIHGNQAGAPFSLRLELAALEKLHLKPVR